MNLDVLSSELLKGSGVRPGEALQSGAAVPAQRAGTTDGFADLLDRQVGRDLREQPSSASKLVSLDTGQGGLAKPHSGNQRPLTGASLPPMSDGTGAITNTPTNADLGTAAPLEVPAAFDDHVTADRLLSGPAEGMPAVARFFESSGLSILNSPETEQAHKELDIESRQHLGANSLGTETSAGVTAQQSAEVTNRSAAESLQGRVEAAGHAASTRPVMDEISIGDLATEPVLLRSAHRSLQDSIDTTGPGATVTRTGIGSADAVPPLTRPAVQGQGTTIQQEANLPGHAPGRGAMAEQQSSMHGSAPNPGADLAARATLNTMSPSASNGDTQSEFGLARVSQRVSTANALTAAEVKADRSDPNVASSRNASLEATQTIRQETMVRSAQASDVAHLTQGNNTQSANASAYAAKALQGHRMRSLDGASSIRTFDSHAGRAGLDLSRQAVLRANPTSLGEITLKLQSDPASLPGTAHGPTTTNMGSIESYTQHSPTLTAERAVPATQVQDASQNTPSSVLAKGSGGLAGAGSAVLIQAEANATLEQQVARVLARHAAAQERITLQLHPRELGMLDIEVSQERGELSISIAVREGSTRELLEASLHRLRQAMSESGQEASFDISHRDGSAHTGADTEQPQTQRAMSEHRDLSGSDDSPSPVSPRTNSDRLLETYV